MPATRERSVPATAVSHSASAAAMTAPCRSCVGEMTSPRSAERSVSGRGRTVMRAPPRRAAQLRPHERAGRVLDPRSRRGIATRREGHRVVAGPQPRDDVVGPVRGDERRVDPGVALRQPRDDDADLGIVERRDDRAQPALVHDAVGDREDDDLARRDPEAGIAGVAERRPRRARVEQTGVGEGGDRLDPGDLAGLAVDDDDLHLAGVGVEDGAQRGPQRRARVPRGDDDAQRQRRALLDLAARLPPGAAQLQRQRQRARRREHAEPGLRRPQVRGQHELRRDGRHGEARADDQPEAGARRVGSQPAHERGAGREQHHREHEEQDDRAGQAGEDDRGRDDAGGERDGDDRRRRAAAGRRGQDGSRQLLTAHASADARRAGRDEPRRRLAGLAGRAAQEGDEPGCDGDRDEAVGDDPRNADALAPEPRAEQERQRQQHGEQRRPRWS